MSLKKTVLIGLALTYVLHATLNVRWFSGAGCVAQQEEGRGFQAIRF